MAGKFIVFEGVDGSGTTTQAMVLHDYLLSKSHKALLTSEPSPGPIGNMIREIHTKRISISDNQDIREELLSYLFAADRCDHLYNDINGITKQVAAGYYVISTRYFLSSFAYHVIKDEDYESIHRLNKHFPRPDYTFFLDCPVECALKRITSARLPDINEEKSNLQRVAKNYHYAISKYNGAISLIDATQEPSKISSQIVSVLVNKGIL
ncbi:MAG: dTMP kinase [Treponema sp.]|jgi:dTMP kinase|nr:dTMP kinase [Treponema sp.]